MGRAKNKTHKATAKRFKVKGKGNSKKMVHNHQGDNAHLKTNKSNRQLRRQEGKSDLQSSRQKKKLLRLILN